MSGTDGTDVPDPTSSPDPDEELLAEVHAAVVAADPPPPGLRDVAMRALTWDAEAEALQLAFDSAKEPTSVMRSGVSAVRDLTFEQDDLAIEVSVGLDDRGATVVEGMVSGEIATAMVVQPERSDQRLEIDDHGRFRTMATGLVACIVVTTTDGRRVRTDLFSLDPEPGR